ncbi:hypothetical protein [uncultured Duncaniella sp.]|nr:hypothetical protein [uncultured Duncaniella sp.]
MTAPTVMAKEYHETWCGEKVTTVDKEAFEDQGEADDYYELLDIIFCGSTKPA